MTIEEDQQKMLSLGEIHEFDINIVTREIFLYDEIVPATAIRFKKNLSILESLGHEPVIIHQYSIGGESTAGMMIYDSIVLSPLSFLYVTHGLAASMGSILPQAVIGKGVRATMPSCDWMIHEGSCMASNNMRAAFSYMDFEKILVAKFYDIFGHACAGSDKFKNKTPAQVSKSIKAKLQKKEDWWMTAEESVAYGFCDTVLSNEITQEGIIYGLQNYTGHEGEAGVELLPE